jgi:Na+/glutamate symporter
MKELLIPTIIIAGLIGTFIAWGLQNAYTG